MPQPQPSIEITFSSKIFERKGLGLRQRSGVRVFQSRANNDIGRFPAPRESGYFLRRARQ